jgi:hypothetical protein
MPKLTLKLPVLQTRTREVVILPDHRFFMRSVALTDETEAGPVADQIELALEGMAPFPLSQTLWAYWTKPGCGHAMVFAAYQKRFTAEEMEAWGEAEWVTPRLSTLLIEMTPAAATTYILTAEDGLTAVHFGDASGVPTQIRAVALSPEVSDREIATAREELIRACGGSTTVRDLEAAEVEAGQPGTDEILIKRAGKDTSVSLDLAQSLDVRDQAELTGRRRARVRDSWLWRGLVAALVTLLLAGVTELSLWGTSFWQDALHQQVQVQSPIVSEIETADRLATRIEELHTKRLRPFEMIAIADGPRPETIIFLRTEATGLYSLEIEAETDDLQAINIYVSALTDLTTTEGVEILNLDTRGSQSTMRLLVRFTFDAFDTNAETEDSA